eukprot:350396-Chlamydomonas_euryale.AAC.6
MPTSKLFGTPTSKAHWHAWSQRPPAIISTPRRKMGKWLLSNLQSVELALDRHTTIQAAASGTAAAFHGAATLLCCSAAAIRTDAAVLAVIADAPLQLLLLLLLLLMMLWNPFPSHPTLTYITCCWSCASAAHAPGRIKHMAEPRTPHLTLPTHPTLTSRTAGCTLGPPRR